MLLAIDIGNTNLVIGCIENDKILFKARIATDAIRTSDQYGVEIKNMMEAFGVQVKDIDDCIISSVVPPVFNSVKTGVIKVIRKQPMVVSLDALTSRTAQLPGISLDKPKHVIGKNTVDCMRSGMMYGTAAMLDGLVERIEAELGHKSTLIATGGLAQFITPLCKREIILEKDLLLKGLNVIYKKNKR